MLYIIILATVLFLVLILTGLFNSPFRNTTIALLSILPLISSGQDPNVETTMIWDKGNHNAFTDLIRFKSAFYCTFREGNSHVPKNASENGSIRIIRSYDGISWEPVALLTDELYDLRDPKLSVMPDGRLMVIMGGSDYSSGKLSGMVPHVSFSGNGSDFSKPVPVSIENGKGYDWIWRVTWKGNTGYGVDYQPGSGDSGYGLKLLQTTDGISWKSVTSFNIEPSPNEATIRFDKKGNMMILLRREAGANGLIGISPPPYTGWKWTELDYRLGGPDFLILKKNTMLIGTRLYQTGSNSTVIYVTGNEGKVRKSVMLPSGGDTSYPGLLIHKKTLWISYYSSHAGKTSIYLSRIRMKDLLNE